MPVVLGGVVPRTWAGYIDERVIKLNLHLVFNSH